MPEPIGPGSLKCVVCVSAGTPLLSDVDTILRAHIEPHNISQLADGALLAYTTASPEEIRDWLVDAFGGGESVFVCEFERWSSRGSAADRDWLRVRGH